MKKSLEVYLGDRVKTKKSFKPMIKEGDRFDPKGTLYEGVVIGKRGGFVLVNLDEQQPFTHFLGNMVETPTGCAINQKDLDIIESYSSDDKGEREFVGLMKELRFEELQKIPKQIRVLEDNLFNNASLVKQYYREMDAMQKKVDDQEFELKELKDKKTAATIDSAHIANQYKQMKKNKKIKSVEIITRDSGTDVLLTTDNLTYHSNHTRMFDYDLGAYKILIPLNLGNSVKCANYKKHIRKSDKHHPCVSNFSMCLGNAMKAEVAKLRTTNNIINLSHLLINFLEQPNYGGPYISDEQFYSAQPVTMRPRQQYNWFDRGYWEKNEKWDGKKYTEDQKALAIKMKKEHGAQTPPDEYITCGECEEEYRRSEILDNDGECPNCGNGMLDN